jgi:Histidine kinase-, DNA gyrase B-, and HSP90-like ATPase
MRFRSTLVRASLSGRGSLPFVAAAGTREARSFPCRQIVGVAATGARTMPALPDYSEGIKKEVVEIKFLIHDLRVERFINEVIHFHVTLNTDLELCGVDQAQVLHGQDLEVLKEKAVSLRKAFQDYSNAVRNFSPDRTVLLAGRHYVNTIYSVCELVLSPLWGRVDKVLTFLPPDSRSNKARTHYLNCIHFIRGVYHRIQQFLDEQDEKGVYQEFDIAAEIEEFTRDVVYSYVMEHSSGRVQIELDRLDPAVVGGNLPRFRRMLFNLVMNAADAMSNRDAGVVAVSDTLDGDRVVLEIRDNGVGMAPEKITQLLTDRATLDGELHSLGFVFVRQTVREFGADLSIESAVGKGTTITIRFPCLPGEQAGSRAPSTGAAGRLAPRLVGPPSARPLAPSRPSAAAPATPTPAPAADSRRYGRLVAHDYETCEAQYPGAIFAMSVTDEGEVDFFAHAPYEKYGATEHAGLSPMFFEVAVRGRMEPDEEKKPTITLKAPQNVREYFESKNVPEAEWGAATYARMVRDEYIRVARTLVETGMPPDTVVLLDRLQEFFAGETELARAEPFSLGLLAGQPLTGRPVRT